MDDLVAWLRAQLDEDERVARAADEGPWVVGTTSGMAYGGHVVHFEDGQIWPQRRVIRGSHVASAPASGKGRMIADLADGYRPSRREENAEHIARHDPARVLREVEAKRRLLDEVKQLIDTLDAKIESEWGDGHDGPTGESDLLLKLLALPYSDRPGYREEWRP
jgi:hypothetical protein